MRHFRLGRRPFAFLVLLFFSISAHCKDAAKSLPSSGIQNAFRLYAPESAWLLADLDGDHTPDFVGGHGLEHTKDGYFYWVQLQLSSGASPSSFAIFHNNALGLKINGVDIDGDNDIDVIISDRFFRQNITVWLNDGKGRFVKSPPGRFSTNAGSDLAFVAVDLNWTGQPTPNTQQRRLPGYLVATGYIKPLPPDGLAFKQHRVEWLFHVAAETRHQRAPPTTLTV